jgi:hypothetical protein
MPAALGAAQRVEGSNECGKSDGKDYRDAGRDAILTKTPVPTMAPSPIMVEPKTPTSRFSSPLSLI